MNEALHVLALVGVAGVARYLAWGLVGWALNLLGVTADA